MAQANDKSDMVESKPTDPITMVPPKPPAKPLANNRLRLICASSSDICNRFAAVLPTGTPYEAALEPGFWSNVCSQLRIGDLVEIHSDSRLFYGTVYVREVAKVRAQVARLEYHEFDVLTQSADTATYRVKYTGIHSKWGIERIADGKLMREGCEDQRRPRLRSRPWNAR